MGIITCASCGNKVNSESPGCPECGADPRTGVLSDATASLLRAQAAAVQHAPAPVAFRESAVEPVFTYAYNHHGRQRELRFFEKHLTYHHEPTGPGREGFYVVAYRSISHLEYAHIDSGPVAFIYVADLALSAAGSEVDIRAFIERVTSLIL